MIRLFRVVIPTSIIGLLISEILLVLAIFIGMIFWEFEAAQFFLLYDNGLTAAAIATATVILGLYFSDCYEQVRIRSKLAFVQQLCLIIGVAFLFQAVLSYASLTIRMPRQAMLAGSLLCLMLLPLWRTFYSKVAFQVLGAEKVLFAGTHPLQIVLAKYLSAHPEFVMEPIGFMVESASPPSHFHEYPVLGGLADIPDLIARIRCDRIIVGLVDDELPGALQAVMGLRRIGRKIDPVDAMYESVCGRVPISQLKPMHMVFQDGFAPGVFVVSLQAVYSWLFAFVGLILVSPILLAAAIAVRVTTGGPVLFRQIRAGKNNAPFVLYKFRSMYIDAEAETGAVWAQENDPRVTPVGRFLRRFRLDELPQLFNVLMGDMSIVGPRPERPEFIKILAEEVPYYMQRMCVKPGITGWAQINYRYGNTLEDTVTKLEYDLFYVKHLAPQLDFYIMFHTLKTMLLTDGAY